MTAAAAVFSSDILLAQNEPTRALPEAERAQREGDGSRVAWEATFSKALAHARLENWDQADQLAEELRVKAESIPADRDKRLYRWLVGEIALARGDSKKAIEELERARSMLPPRGFPPHGPGGIPPHVALWFSLASAYLTSGDDDNAEAWFTRIVESTTEHILGPVPYARSFYFLGKIHEERGESEKAREYYQRFVDFWGDGDLDRERVEEARGKLAS